MSLLQKINRNGLPEWTGFNFLNIFKEVGQRVYFRTIHDVVGYANNYNCLLDNSDDLGYPLAEKVFKKYQKDGCGIYVVINNGGSRINAIKKISAQFIDLDFGKIPKLDASGQITKDDKNKTVYEYRTKEEIEELKEEALFVLSKFSLEPTIIVETANGFHVYWVLDRKAKQYLPKFVELQKALIRHFDSDPKVITLERVQRVPGYFHLKDPNNPFLIKTIFCEPKNIYTQEQIAIALGLKLEDIKDDLAQENTKKKLTSKGTIKKQQNKEQQVGLSPLAEEDAPSKKIEFDNFADAFDYAKTQDLRKYIHKILNIANPINVELGVAFNCLWHDDSRPSMVIDGKDGYFRVFCNSTNCDLNNDNYGLDIFNLAQKVHELTFVKAMEYVFSLLNIQIKKSEWIESQKKKYELNALFLNDLNADSADRYPFLDRILKSSFLVLNYINTIALIHIREDFIYQNESVFFTSNRYLAKRAFRGNYQKVNKFINLWAVLGLITKNIKYELPNRIKKKAIKLAQKRTKGSKKRQIIEFYAMPNFYDVAEEAEKRAKKLITEGKFKIDLISKNYITNLFGEDFANQIYGQVFGAHSTSKIQVHIMAEILNHLQHQKYITLNQLLKKQIVVDNAKIGKERLEKEFRRALPLLIEAGLIYKKPTKLEKKELGLSSHRYIVTKAEYLPQKQE